jgi:hypothetical protein
MASRRESHSERDQSAVTFSRTDAVRYHWGWHRALHAARHGTARHVTELCSNVTSAVTSEGLGLSLLIGAVLHFHELKIVCSLSSEGPAITINRNYRTEGFV